MQTATTDTAQNLHIRLAEPYEAALVHGLTLAGFDEYRSYPLPSSALRETYADVERALTNGGALLAFNAAAPPCLSLGRSHGAEPIGTARFVVRWGAPVEEALGPLLLRARAGEAFRESPGGVLSFSRMVVLPHARGMGVGRALVTWLERLAQQLGLATIEITARSQQPDNRPFYQRLGYRITGYSESYGIADMVTHLCKELPRS